MAYIVTYLWSFVVPAQLMIVGKLSKRKKMSLQCQLCQEKKLTVTKDNTEGQLPLHHSISCFKHWLIIEY
jgi:hypothetical protein